MDSVQVVIGLRALADIIEMYDQQILQGNVNRRLDRERERVAPAAASTSTRKKRQRKKSLLRKVQVWVKRRRYKLRKLTRKRRGHAQKTRGSVQA